MGDKALFRIWRGDSKSGGFVDYHDPLDAPGCLALVERALIEPGRLAQREQRIQAEYRITSWRDCAQQWQFLAF